MNLVYIHIGKFNIQYKDVVYNPFNNSYTYSSVPEYMWDSIHQSRKYYSGQIFIILPKDDINDSNLYRSKLYNCTLIPFEDFLTGNQTTSLKHTHAIGASYIKEFLKARLSCNNHQVINDHFICVTFLRLFVLCELIRNYQLKCVWHLENDNLIFDKFPWPTNEIRYCNISDKEATAGIMYIPDSNSAVLLAQKLLEEYKHRPEKSETSILKIIGDNSSDIKYFDNLKFDGASYGQFLEGTNQDHPRGHISPHHHASEILSTKGALRYIDNIPYLNNKPVFNLHIHNKKQINKLVHDKIDNITVGVMSAPSLKDRYTACKYTWLNNFKNYNIYCGSTNQDDTCTTLPCGDDYDSAVPKQFLGLKHMYENYKTDWYIFVGCDTYIYHNKLKEVLSKYDSNKSLYIGGKKHAGDFQELYSSDTPCKYFISGGPGIILSRKLVEKIYYILNECTEIWVNGLAEFNSKAHPASGDVAMAYILWKKFNIFATLLNDGFYHCPPKDYNELKEPVCFHYITPEMMPHLYKNDVECL